MNLNQQEAAVFVVLGMSLMFFGRLSVYAAQALYRKFKFELDYERHPRVVPYQEAKLCVDPHQWQDVKLVVRYLPVGTYRICVACGCITGREDYMVSDEVLKLVNEARQIAEQKAQLEKEVHQRINDLTMAQVDRYIVTNFKTEINDVHTAEKLAALSKFTIKALADASEKVSSELTAQVDLDKRYAGWPDKVKGNA